MISENTDRTVELLEEICKWQRFQGFIKLREVLTFVLKTDLDRQIYELSDGRSTNEVANNVTVVKVSNMTVYNYWKRWAKLGIMEPASNFKGRFKRVVSLEDVGIEFQKPQKPTINEPNSSEEGDIAKTKTTLKEGED